MGQAMALCSNFLSTSHDTDIDLGIDKRQHHCPASSASTTLLSVSAQSPPSEQEHPGSRSRVLQYRTDLTPRRSTATTPVFSDHSLSAYHVKRLDHHLARPQQRLHNLHPAQHIRKSVPRNSKGIGHHETHSRPIRTPSESYLDLGF